ncbi:MAG: cytochrome b/b6 domain-containing protein, partial [Anaerolineales bacterium]
ETGQLKPEFVLLQAPTNRNCANCHGEVHMDQQTPLVYSGCSLDQPQTATTGQIISAQKIAFSGMNITGKNDLNYAWDVHAERALKCTDCHFSLNNPTQSQRAVQDNPAHITYDPRRLGISEYLVRPNHNFARGQSAQFGIAPELKGTMRRCDSCHNAEVAHSDWLPYVERHMAVLDCETCHIPKMNAPAIQSYDWTVITPAGEAISQCRGVEGTGESLTDLVTGFNPVLLQRTNVDGHTSLTTYNLITTWFWIYDDANGNTRPVRLTDLQAAYLQDGAYAPDVVRAFDQNGDNSLSATELRLDTAEKTALISNKLQALGLNNPRIVGQVQPYSINHNVVEGKQALSDCQTCHSAESRVTQPMQLASYTPGGVIPKMVDTTNVKPSGNIIQTADGALTYETKDTLDGVYVFGHDRVHWIDWLGAALFIGTVLGVSGHGAMRYISYLRRPKKALKTKRVHMYEAYERFWHWLQTASILILLFTGLVIHRPDMFGAFSFTHMVTVHNVVAAILAINAALSLFWHLTTGEIKQYIPRPRGFIDDAIVQAKFYISGIFKGEAHPFEKRRDRKLNPLQGLTYFGLLNVLLPLQGITGILMWGAQKWPAVSDMLGGLTILAPFHSLLAWSFGAFIVGHVYLTTTGATPVEAMRAMVTGWEELEVHEAHGEEHHLSTESESPEQSEEEQA